MVGIFAEIKARYKKIKLCDKEMAVLEALKPYKTV